MSTKEKESVFFQWGPLRSVGKKNSRFHYYESFTLDDVKYSLYDCVYLYASGEVETYIGKILRMYETPSHERKVKILWFFRPADIHNFLGEYVPRWKEIFIAAGSDTGLFNTNDVEAIIDKCNVVCASSDPRNPQPSKEELRRADYVFYRTFDVGKLRISRNFGDKIANIEVKHIFNRTKVSKLNRLTDPINVARDRPIEVKKDSCNAAKMESPSTILSNKESNEAHPFKIPDSKCFIRPAALTTKSGAPHKVEVNTCKAISTLREHEIRPLKKRRFTFGDYVTSSKNEMGVAATKIPDAEKRSWFKQLPWEERLRRAQEVGSLVLLQNLDPSSTSPEVEELIWEALEQKVEAKMIQRNTFSIPHNGKALVIFKSKDVAESAISLLSSKCLLLEDNRPLIASKGTLIETQQPASFVGHFVLDKLRFQKKKQNMVEAVSTSHCSQPNTIPYDMALDWLCLQRKFDESFKILHENHLKEISNIGNQLKMKYKTKGLEGVRNTVDSLFKQT